MYLLFTEVGVLWTNKLFIPIKSQLMKKQFFIIYLFASVALEIVTLFAWYDGDFKTVSTL